MFNKQVETTRLKNTSINIILLFSLYQAVMNTGLEFYNWL